MKSYKMMSYQNDLNMQMHVKGAVQQTIRLLDILQTVWKSKNNTW